MSAHSYLRLVGRAVAVAALLVGSAGLANATPAYTMDDTTGSVLGNGPFTLGSEFTTRTSISVTGLGVFDDSQDGLLESHAVGIWDSLGNLVASGTVAAGTADPLINQFRYDAITPVVLSPGDYRIGAVWNSLLDGMLFGGATNFGTAAGIAFDENAYIAGGSLSDPTNTAGTDPSYFGPNFTFEAAAAVPEPASLALLGTALVGLGFFRRRRRKTT